MEFGLSLSGPGPVAGAEWRVKQLQQPQVRLNERTHSSWPDRWLLGEPTSAAVWVCLKLLLRRFGFSLGVCCSSGEPAGAAAGSGFLPPRFMVTGRYLARCWRRTFSGYIYFIYTLFCCLFGQSTEVLNIPPSFPSHGSIRWCVQEQQSCADNAQTTRSCS